MKTQYDRPIAVSLRPVCAGDENFLFGLFASTRFDELGLALWGDAEREQFLRIQFTAQQRHYRDHYANARFEIIVLEDQPIGRLHVDWGHDEIRLVEISLLPEYRGFGIGSSIIGKLLAEAASSGKPVRLHVQCTNPAVQLYQRLGFELVSDNSLYYLLEWQSP